MNKTTKFVAMILLTLLAAACDPSYTEDVVIRNASTHYVTIIPLHPETNDTTANIAGKTYTLAPNEEVVIEQLGGIGSASFEEGVNYFKAFYGDSVKLGFGGFGEDGLLREKTYYIWETGGISPYNFQSSNYIYEEKRNTGRVFHDLPYYGKLTFTITDEHYDAAMRR
ncbi:MAG: hypothetical protein J6P54_06620 [Bacteroidales bacterium]|nr:hypothetical protein [Bacteroidales bacterium]